MRDISQGLLLTLSSLSKECLLERLNLEHHHHLWPLLEYRPPTRARQASRTREKSLSGWLGITCWFFGFVLLCFCLRFWLLFFFVFCCFFFLGGGGGGGGGGRCAVIY